MRSLVGCALALVACTNAPPERRARPEFRVPARTWATISDASIDGRLSAPKVARLEAAAAELEAHYPAFSVAVAIPGEGTWSTTRGAAVTSASVFQVASVTKSLVAVAALQVIEEGGLRRDTTVERWAPELPNAERVRVEDLLRHTSGWVSFNALPERAEALDGQPPEALVAAVSVEDPLFAPGQGWAYSNTNYVVLGQILEDVDRRPLREVLEARVFAPVGMPHSRLQRLVRPDPEAVWGHTAGVPLEALPDYATPFGAGGVCARAEDLVRFWHALLSGRLLPPEVVRDMFDDLYPMQPQFPAPVGTAMYYGDGVQLTDTPGGAEGPGVLLESNGGIFGFNAEVAYVVEDGVYVAVLVNDRAVPAAAGLWRVVQALRAE